jgi:hypothetical protein
MSSNLSINLPTNLSAGRWLAGPGRCRFFAAPLAVAMALLAGVFAATPATALVDVRIDLGSQRMQVVSGAGQRYAWPVSTAKRGLVTPRGVFRPQSLRRMHYSRKYAMSPMPHSIFFHGGYAIHGTSAVGRLGSPASHGCVRLAPGNAAKLFGMVQKEGARITITGEAPHTRLARAARTQRPVAVASRRAFTPMAYAPAPRKRSMHDWQIRPVR